MKKSLAFAALIAVTFSCGVFGSLNSNTSIKPHETFVLGHNEHGTFRTRLKNEGVTILKICQKPITGGSHSPVFVNPQQSIEVKTEKNTALIIENTGNDYASVTLKVKGDLNLGMVYNEL